MRTDKFLITTLAMGMICGVALGSIPYGITHNSTVNAENFTIQDDEITADDMPKNPNAPMITAKAGLF